MALVSDRRASLVPSDMPLGHASGPAPFRLLLVGSDAVAGHGVRSHGLALPGCLARSVSGRTGHGAVVELLTGAQPSLECFAGLLLGRDLSGTDAVVVVLDLVRVPRASAAYGDELRRMLTALVDRLPAGVPVVVAAPGPASGAAGRPRHAAHDDAFADVMATAVAALASFVALSVPPAEHVAPSAMYREWAEVVSAALVPRLQEPQLWRSPEQPVDEHARQNAVRRLGPLDRAWQAEFERIVRLAQRAYGTRCASLSIVDGPRTRYLVRQGIDFEEVPREDTICASVLSRREGLIVGDAREDLRFNALPGVLAGDAAFYAGYRVAGPDGQPVGVLCVFDPDPRPVLSQDLTLLRDLARGAQRRIWELAADGVHGSSSGSRRVGSPTVLKS